MSGAVDVGRALAAPFVAPIVAGEQFIQKGTNPIKGFGKEIGRDFNALKDNVAAPVASGFAEGAGLNQDLPNIAVDDPAAKQAADEKNRARAKRQTQLDILQGQPGRGGTVLTDNYQYNV